MTTFFQFSPHTEHVSGELAMVGPKYRGVDDSSKYNPTVQRVSNEKMMTGPVYPGKYLSGAGTQAQFQENILALVAY